MSGFGCLKKLSGSVSQMFLYRSSALGAADQGAAVNSEIRPTKAFHSFIGASDSIDLARLYYICSCETRCKRQGETTGDWRIVSSPRRYEKTLKTLSGNGWVSGSFFRPGRVP